MTIEITHVKYSGPRVTHESIVEFKWKNRETGAVASSTKQALVTWVDEKTNIAFVGSGTQQVRVASIHPGSTPAYLRTYADDAWNNNLLALPTF